MRVPRSVPKPKRPRLFLLRQVRGESMSPALTPGTVVLAICVRTVRCGDIVEVRHEGLDKIKRVQHMQSGNIFVVGDNPTHSTDSRHFGWLAADRILGRVVWPRARIRQGETGRVEQFPYLGQCRSVEVFGFAVNPMRALITHNRVYVRPG